MLPYLQYLSAADYARIQGVAMIEKMEKSLRRPSGGAEVFEL